MRRPLLAGLVSLLIVPFLTACGPSTPGQVTQARSHLDVASPDLVAFKKHSDIPNCPKVTAKGMDGGMPVRMTLDRDLVGIPASEWQVPHITSGHTLLPGAVLLELEVVGQFADGWVPTGSVAPDSQQELVLHGCEPDYCRLVLAPPEEPTNSVAEAQ